MGNVSADPHWVVLPPTPTLRSTGAAPEDRLAAPKGQRMSQVLLNVGPGVPLRRMRLKGQLSLCHQRAALFSSHCPYYWNDPLSHVREASTPHWLPPHTPPPCPLPACRPSQGLSLDLPFLVI